MLPRVLVRWVTALVVATLVGASGSVAEAQRDLDLERFVPTLDADASLGVPGTRTPAPGEWNTTLWVLYARRPLLLETTDHNLVPVVRDRLGADLALQVGL